MASHTVAYGRACFSWAFQRGSLVEKPFRRTAARSVEKRERVLADNELRVILSATSAPGSIKAIVRALIHTGQRREELAEMAWREVSPDRSL